MELRLLIKKEQASILHLKVTWDEFLESLGKHQPVNEDEIFAQLMATKRELYSTEQYIQKLEHALQQAKQRDPQYLSKQLDSLKHQTSNISYLIEAVDVLLKYTDKSVSHVDKQFNTLTCIMNNITDHLEHIKLNQVVITQWQPHTKPEKVKEGEESLFFDNPPHVVNTPYHAADTPFTVHPLFSPLAQPTSLDSPSFSSKILTGLLTYNPEHDGDPEPFLQQLENNL